MKVIGAILCVIGILWGLAAVNMKTTVELEYRTFGSTEVNNIGLMEARRNHLMGAGLSLLLGVILLAAGVLQSNSGSEVGEASSSEKAGGASTSFFKGELDLNDLNYQLYLTKKYGIERNNTLQKFVCNDIVYNSLEDALKVFHEKELKKNTATDLVEPTINDRLQLLFSRVENSDATVETYMEIASHYGGSVTSNGFLSYYIVDIYGTKNRVDNFEDLKGWFLKNVQRHVG